MIFYKRHAKKGNHNPLKDAHIVFFCLVALGFTICWPQFSTGYESFSCLRLFQWIEALESSTSNSFAVLHNAVKIDIEDG